VLSLSAVIFDVDPPSATLQGNEQVSEQPPMSSSITGRPTFALSLGTSEANIGAQVATNVTVKIIEQSLTERSQIKIAF
jgi:hypothetical protein